jgi:hypothetical protein
MLSSRAVWIDPSGIRRATQPDGEHIAIGAREVSPVELVEGEVCAGGRRLALGPDARSRPTAKPEGI